MKANQPEYSCVLVLKNSVLGLGLVDDYGLPPVNNPNLKLEKLASGEAEGLYNTFGEVDAISCVFFASFLGYPLNEAHFHTFSPCIYGKIGLKIVVVVEQKAYKLSSRKYNRGVVE